MAGSIILSLALVFSAFTLITYAMAFKGKEELAKFARLSYHIMTMLVIAASSYLLYLILTHQYQYGYVYEYSSDNLSLGFLISTFWAGQQGSFMLWLLLTAVVGIFLQSYTAKRGKLEFSVMAVFTLATTFLLAMVSPLLKNPFEMIYAQAVFIDIKNLNQTLLNNPIVQSHLFSDPNSGQNFFQMNVDSYAALQSGNIGITDLIAHGKGLNPLLQNFWMQIHPPILFMGFSMATVPFSFAISALLTNDYRNWVRQSFPWVLAGAGILGLGIMLGGYWAYGVLGWGGYWAWDPVENSSLVPWLVSVAAVHTMIVQRKSQSKSEGIGRFGRTNLILCILTYVLVIYSTFLTRSGILGDASVHSFVDPGMHVYIFLLVFVVSFTLFGLGMVAFRWKALDELIPKDESALSRELALFTAAVALGASALIVVVGTSAPIIKQTVETKFYNDMHVPLAIIIGLLNGLSLALRWKSSSAKEVWEKSRVSIILSVFLTLGFVVLGGVHRIMMILLMFATAYTLFINTEIAYKVMKGNKKMAGAYLAHIGIALFILGVIGSGAYSIETSVDLVRGRTAQVLGYQMTFTDIHPVENNTKYAFNIDVVKGDKLNKIKPVMYISEFNNGLMREPDILTGLIRDIYISPSGYEDGSQQKSSGNEVTVSIGEESRVIGKKIKYIEFIKPDMSVMASGGDFTMGAKVQVESDGKAEIKDVLMQRKNGQVEFTTADFADAGLRVRLTKIDPGTKQAVLDVVNTNAPAVSQPKEVLSVTASIKPFINLVWLGVAVMVIGFFVAASRRMKETLVS